MLEANDEPFVHVHSLWEIKLSIVGWMEKNWFLILDFSFFSEKRINFVKCPVGKRSKTAKHNLNSLETKQNKGERNVNHGNPTIIRIFSKGKNDL